MCFTPSHFVSLHLNPHQTKVTTLPAMRWTRRIKPWFSTFWALVRRPNPHGWGSPDFPPRQHRRDKMGLILPQFISLRSRDHLARCCGTSGTSWVWSFRSARTMGTTAPWCSPVSARKPKRQGTLRCENRNELTELNQVSTASNVFYRGKVHIHRLRFCGRTWCHMTQALVSPTRLAAPSKSTNKNRWSGNLGKVKGWEKTPSEEVYIERLNLNWVNIQDVKPSLILDMFFWLQLHILVVTVVLKGDTFQPQMCGHLVNSPTSTQKPDTNKLKSTYQWIKHQTWDKTPSDIIKQASNIIKHHQTSSNIIKHQYNMNIKTCAINDQGQMLGFASQHAAPWVPRFRGRPDRSLWFNDHHCFRDV